MRLALIQMNLQLGNPKQNIEHVSNLVSKAVQEQPDIIVLPEMWNSSYDLTNLAELADKDGEPAAETMAILAKKYGVNIVAGSISDYRQGKFYNTSYVFDRQGKRIARYSKIHLFGLMQEGEYLTAGHERVSFTLDGQKYGIIICYDLRFPELSRSLALEGAEILFVPAQWPEPRMHPWRTLLQARAIENQFFVVAVNRVGVEGKASFLGHSMVVNPLGRIISEGSEEEEIIFVDIDPEEVKRVRERMDCFGDRVPSAYDCS